MTEPRQGVRCPHCGKKLAKRLNGKCEYKSEGKLIVSVISVYRLFYWTKERLAGQTGHVWENCPNR